MPRHKPQEWFDLQDVFVNPDPDSGKNCNKMQNNYNGPSVTINNGDYISIRKKWLYSRSANGKVPANSTDDTPWESNRPQYTLSIKQPYRPDRQEPGYALEDYEQPPPSPKGPVGATAEAASDDIPF